MNTNTSTDRGGRATAAALIVTALVMLLAALAFAATASAEEREPEYAASYYAFDCAQFGDIGVYAGWDSERDGRPIEICSKPGFEPVKYEGQCQFGGTWRADLGGGSCLFRQTKPPVCEAPHVLDENGTCWFQLLTDLHVPPVVDPGDGGGEGETEPPPDPAEEETDQTDGDQNEGGEKTEDEKGATLVSVPVCVEHAAVQDNADAATLAVGDGFYGADGVLYRIVTGEANGCSFGCVGGWDANCDGRIGDFCRSEYDRFTVFGVWQCMRQMAPSIS